MGNPMKRLVLGGGHHLPSYRWYRRQLQKGRQRVVYNRTHRDAEEEEARSGSASHPNGNEKLHTVITPHRTPFQRFITTGALILFIGCGCLFGGAVIDLFLHKPGAVSGSLTMGSLTTIFFLAWRFARLAPGSELSGDVYGHIEHSSLRLHETVGRNVEVLSMTVVPEHTAEASSEPLEVEVVGEHIEGAVNRGDKVTLHGTWQRKKPIRVKRLYDLTKHTWVTAKSRLTAIKRGEELLFLAALILVTVLFFLAVARLL